MVPATHPFGNLATVYDSCTIQDHSHLERNFRCLNYTQIFAMSSQVDSIVDHVRTKLRRCRSSVISTAQDHTQHHYTDWDNVPSAFWPLESKAPGANKPLPGLPPRPRTASPSLAPGVRAGLDIRRPRIPNLRTRRNRSAETAHQRRSALEGGGSTDHDKRASVEIARALLPYHLDPPPPYSRHANPPLIGADSRSRKQPRHPREADFMRKKDTNDCTSRRSQSASWPVDAVPIIVVPASPTPVSPLNTLDHQYLAYSNQPRDPDSPRGVTVDSLLSHPILQSR